MAVHRPMLAVALVGATLAAGCAQPAPGSPRPDPGDADRATLEAVRQGVDAFRSHFLALGDEHARVYNYLNYGDVKITTDHESYKFDDPPVTLTRRRLDQESDDWSQTLHQADDKVDYIELDEAHASLAPTPWVSVPSLFQAGEFDVCALLTAWAACQLDSAIAATTKAVPNEQPREARATKDGFEVVTGALLGEMMREGLISVPEDMQDDITEPMRARVVRVTIKFDEGMGFRAFEIRDRITDGDETPLELQIGYEVLEQTLAKDMPDAPAASEVTAITDPAAVDKFWDAFNDRDPTS